MGIKIGDTVHVGTQYADNFWLSLWYSEDNLNEVLTELQEFEQFSGLHTNYRKTLVLPIGTKVGSAVQLNTLFPLRWTNDPFKILGIYVHPSMDIMLEINYSPLSQRVRDIITMWRYRDLTPIGKVQLVNSFISSLFVYGFMCLPSPSKEFFDAYKKLINRFIWSSPTNKVRYTKMVQDYSEEGLKLIDLPAKDQSVKALWIEKAMSDVNLPIYCGLPIKAPIIWQCNMSTLDMNVSKFSLSQQVWFLWAQTNVFSPENTSDILDQVLWLNYDIRCAGKVLLNEEARLAGLVKIQDIYDMINSRFLMCYEFTDEFGEILDRLQYNSLITSIPRRWKTFLTQRVVGDKTLRGLELLPNGQKLSKYVYWKLIAPMDKKHPPDTLPLLWTRESGKEINNWDQVLLIPLKLTTYTKLQFFQYRCIHKILTTNVQRSKYADVTDKCVFCDNQKETMNKLLL